MKDAALKYFVLTVLVFIPNFTVLFSQGLLVDHKQAHLEDLQMIPPEWIDSAKAKLRIVYWHTSHGSHITTGMSRLDAFMGGNGIYTRAEEKLPGVLYLVDYFGDLSAGEETWPQTTRDYLDDDANQDINVVMWSWCQILGHDGDEDPGYCSKMDSLIAEYGPGGTKIASGERTVPVRFVFMTGHVNGQGEEGRTNQTNTYIRKHCIANNRILYDFADIESWDPDDNYFLDDYVDDDCSYLVNGERTGNWANEWIVGKVQMDGEDDTVHNEPNGGVWYQCTAEHSHPVNANMKAYAAWYMFARLAGWKILVTSIDVQGEEGSTTITTNRGTLQMAAEVLPAEADDTTITWSVNNGTGEASISRTGLLQAVSNGTVTVVATANDGSDIQDSLQVTISNQIILVSSISLAGEGGSTTIDQDNGTLQISASISPADATDSTVTWTVTNGTGKASISQTGLLQAFDNGTVTVLATANDNSGISDSIQITLSNQVYIPVTSISIYGEGGLIIIDIDKGTLQIFAAISPPNASDTTILWSVINGTGRASITPWGLLQADSNGTVTVVAMANDGTGVTDSLQVTISHQIVLVSSISLTGEGGSTSIDQYGGSLQVNATVLPLEVTDSTLSWTVINGTGQATISLAGLLQAVSDGTVTVVATANDGSGVRDSLQ
ncbi:MAG: Ig-like domain-containing protein, partial [Bacteroidales bacterium]|nr:Ig-like domain-containing protein [Bacteroidales bacterium]